MPKWPQLLTDRDKIVAPEPISNGANGIEHTLVQGALLSIKHPQIEAIELGLTEVFVFCADNDQIEVAD